MAKIVFDGQSQSTCCWCGKDELLPINAGQNADIVPDISLITALHRLKIGLSSVGLHLVDRSFFRETVTAWAV